MKLLQTPERTQFKLMEVKKMKLQVHQEINLVPWEINLIHSVPSIALQVF